MTSRPLVDGGLRALLIGRLPHPHHLTPVETGMVVRGVPDLHCLVDGVATWVECKATSGWVVALRPGQIGWAVAHCRHGGRVVIAVRRRTDGGPRAEAADELWLLRGAYARELRAGGLRWALQQPAALLGRWPGGPRQWGWGAVRAALLRT